MESKPLKTFIIYSHEDLAYKTGLEKFLRHLVRTGKIVLWSDKEIKPGEYWNSSIQLNLGEAEVIIILVSVDFYYSDYIQDIEFQHARERLDSGQALIVPVLARYCPWRSYDLIKDLQALPSGAKSIDEWSSTDKAFTDVAENLERLVDEMLARRASESRRIGEDIQREQEDLARRESEENNHRTQTLHLERDEAAWEATREEVETATSAIEKIAAYEVYLESGFNLYSEEAKRFIHVLEATNETKRRIAERKNSLKEKETYDYFISYAWEDKTVAMALSQALKNNGLKIWIDQEFATSGYRLDEALKQCRRSVLLLSHYYFKKFWTLAEMDANWALFASNGKKMQFIPVRLGITQDELLDFSPMLAGLMALEQARDTDDVSELVEKLVAMAFDLP